MAKINGIPPINIEPSGPSKPTQSQVLLHILMQGLQKAIAYMIKVQKQSAEEMKKSITGQS